MATIIHSPRWQITSLSLLLLTSALIAQEAPKTETEPKKDEVIVLDKLESDDGLDPSGVLPPSNNVFGLSKSALETPRQVSNVTGDMIEKFNISDLADLQRFSPSTYTAYSFGVQGAQSIRGDSADVFYNGMKKLNNASNVPTIIGATDGVIIVRGPPSAAYGAGQVGGYMNIIPKSARASTGKYLNKYTGKATLTVDNWGKKVGTLEVGGPTTVFGKRAGFYVFTQQEDSKTYYIGQKIIDQVFQGTLTVDVTHDLRLEVGGSYQHHHGTGIAGWNRVTQDLVDNRTYQTGMPDFSKIDTNNDGTASRAELFNAGLTNNYNFNANNTPKSGQVKAGTTAYTNPNGPLKFVTNVGTAKLDPRQVLLERINYGVDYIGFLDLVNDANPDLTFSNKMYWEQQNYHKLSDIAYFRAGDTTVAEDRATVEWHPQHLPDWVEVGFIAAANARYLDAFNQTTNVFQIFNYWDLTQFTNGHYLFQNGWDSPTTAGIDSRAKSQTMEGGLGTVLDMTFLKKLTVTLGGRYDMVNAEVQNYPGLSTKGNTVLTPTAASRAEASDARRSLSSASISYKVLPNVSPYFTYANPSSVVPGTTGGVSSSQVNTGLLTTSELIEGGIKGEFFKGKLFASYGAYKQLRTAFQQSLNGGNGGFQQTKSIGNEAEVRWVPTRNFNLSAAVDMTLRYTDPLTAGQTPATVQEVGLDPINFGGGRYQKDYNLSNTRRPAPPVVASLFGDYVFGNSGFDVSVGTNYTKGYYASNLEGIHLPASFTISTDVGYRTKTWEVRLSVKNLTNELYFTSTSGDAALIPQPGRTFTAKFTYKF
ncbi:MAG: TonB-dependent receptor plug domain-containing protein [Verrucomicrobia bacterium]|nr:TonB-dependent receptor plug domain-containing protein [Verrucomicrobiota bacterium]